MTSRSETLNAVNQLAEDWYRRPQVDVNKPTHALARYCDSYVQTKKPETVFVNTGQDQTLTKRHFQEYRYQEKVEIPVNIAMSGAKIPGAVVRDAQSISCPCCVLL